MSTKRRSAIMDIATNWDPFRDVDEAFNRYAMFPWGGLGRRLRGMTEGTGWSPSADISETEGGYLIKADLPGVKKEDVKVSLGEGFITISGERKEEKEAKGENQLRMERFYGQFSRRFSLPDDVDPGAITAKNEHGTLTVHIPKKKGIKTKEVAIPVK